MSVKSVTKSYGDRTVLDQVSFTVRPGEKAAVIGENGSGKSTLLRLLAAAELPDAGELTVHFPGGTGYLAQTLDLDADCTVQDAVDLALSELREMERQLRAAEESLADASPEEMSSYGALLIAYEERGGYEADARVDAAMHGLGLTRITRERQLGSLSGGEQSRLALACVLAAAPELLLLDEPTNHLDAAAVRWLEEHLRVHRGTVVAVTHDRGFLERIATTILEVDRDERTVRRYGDGWTGYRAAKAAARRGAEQRYAEWVAEVAEMEELLEAAGRRLATTGGDPKQGFGKHRRSSETKLGGQVRSIRERLDRLRRSPVAPPPTPLRFTPTLPSPSVAGSSVADGSGQGVLAVLDDVRVGGRLRLDGRLTIEPGGRLLVTGENGAGKTTLLRVLAGDLQPDSGTVCRPARIGYLAQELPAHTTRLPLLAAFAAGRPDLLAGEQRPTQSTPQGPTGGLEGYAEQRPPRSMSSGSTDGLGEYAERRLPRSMSSGSTDGLEGYAEQRLLRSMSSGSTHGLEEYAELLLSLGLFRERDLQVPVAALSVGQQRRLQLAMLVTQPADLLVLDEPTNHIALDLVEDLQAALAEYPGAVVAVSHDRDFRARFAAEHLELHAGHRR
ncbi:ATP-binding cassette domain-containing protein [Kribbella sp. HUAS MG21]|uniref:ATP-binding cassette domain-containing protein n=1 Tax=Kribbella sp. HUAS MG21 TaxID=3160966 RepID=A0AAU7T9Q5_9ACTN